MSCISSINIKHLKLTALFLISPLFFFAQSLTGLWTGALSNDSTTIRKDQSFEIALTEYRGKVYGYSRSEFIVNDTLYYILKRVKGTIEGNLCEVTDDEIISYNFRGKLDKGIKVTSIFRRNQTDSTWYLDGTWKTNATRKYYAVTGKVGLQEEKDLNASKLFPHLEELNLANDVAFYKERKEEPVIVKVAHPEKIKTEYNDRSQPLLINNDIAVVPVQPKLQKAEAGPVPVSSNETIDDMAKVDPQAGLHAEKKPVADLPKPDIKKIPVTTVAVTPASVKKTVAETKKPEAIVTPDKKNTSVATNPYTEKKEARPDEPVGRIKSGPIAKTLVKQEQPVVKNQSPPIKQPAAIVNKPDTKSVVISNPVPEKRVTEPVIMPEIPEVKKPAADVTVKAAIIEGRKSEFSQVVNFKADSLELSLYDNGEIDGDTVSVFMNGEVLLSRQGLKASAIKKTIYITPGNEDFTLVLFADNLGKYPPNTGLLVVHDGEDVYNLRFSSDLQKSAGIVFKRKK
ncbi:MAG TPA: hypothetical protein VIV35_03180 [Chitinophagaceae bacterium]